MNKYHYSRMIAILRYYEQLKFNKIDNMLKKSKNFNISKKYVKKTHHTDNGIIA